jgi:hypothetical protein
MEKEPRTLSSDVKVDERVVVELNETFQISPPPEFSDSVVLFSESTSPDSSESWASSPEHLVAARKHGNKSIMCSDSNLHFSSTSEAWHPTSTAVADMKPSAVSRTTSTLSSVMPDVVLVSVPAFSRSKSSGDLPSPMGCDSYAVEEPDDDDDPKYVDEG